VFRTYITTTVNMHNNMEVSAAMNHTVAVAAAIISRVLIHSIHSLLYSTSAKGLPVELTNTQPLNRPATHTNNNAKINT